MPIVAAMEDRMQLTWRSDVAWFGQRVIEIVAIFAGDMTERDSDEADSHVFCEHMWHQDHC